MIKQIHIKNVATFQDEILMDLQPINIIYGANGSGKTTLSKIISSPEKYSASEIIWDEDKPLDVLVYNKDFRESNLRENRLKGVFTLGHESAEKIDEINKKKKEQDRLTSKIDNLRNLFGAKIQEIVNIKNIFEKTCWENCKNERKSILKEALKGACGSVKAFADKLIEYKRNNKGTLKDYDEIVRIANILLGPPPQVTKELEEISFNSIRYVEVHDIWQKKILGNSDIDIAPLIQRLEMSDWVNQGRKYMEKHTNVCPFCQQRTITDELRNQLEDYFDETFNHDVGLIKSLSSSYKQSIDRILIVVDELLSQEKSGAYPYLDKKEIVSLRELIVLTYSKNQENISSKIKEPSQSIELKSVAELIISLNQQIENTNNAIKADNELVAEFKSSKDNLITDVWKYLVEKNSAHIDSYEKSLAREEKIKSKLNESIEKYVKKYQQLEDDIKESSKTLASVEASIDEINRLLQNYGFTTFSIVSAGENFYKIQRENGDSAVHTLSEGEATFISFLYFMQQVKGSISNERVSTDRVIVIDDPVSSLDSSVLHVVSSLIKGEMERVINGHSTKSQEPYQVKQICILTHNVYFHKEVTNLRQQYVEKLHYWILKRTDKESKFIPCKGNPIRGSYEMLWRECRLCDDRSIVSLQNIMRRIIETYFRIIGNIDYQTVCDKMDNSQDRDICRALVGWVNDGSHSIADDLYITHGEHSIEHYRKVFKKFFEEAGQIQHYNMMMSIKIDES